MAATNQTPEERRWSQRKAKRQAAKKTDPLNTPELRAEIVRLLKEGCTTREICERDDMPARSSLFDWLEADPAFRLAYEKAKVECATAVIDDAHDYVREAVETDDAPDHARVRAAEVLSKAASNYAAAIAPRQFGQLVKLGAEGEAGAMTVQIIAYTEPNPRGTQSFSRGEEDSDKPSQGPSTGSDGRDDSTSEGSANPSSTLKGP